jgi:predicted RNA-binding protein with PUA-like domain
MARWLIKEEPTHYGFADLLRDRTAEWDGVRNNLARKYLRQMRKGDRLLYYHTGKERAIVGEAVALTNAWKDASVSDPGAVTVKIKAVAALAHPVTLKQVKADATLADWELVRFGRLSVMPVSEEQWRRVVEMSKGGRSAATLLGKPPWLR